MATPLPVPFFWSFNWLVPIKSRINKARTPGANLPRGSGGFPLALALLPGIPIDYRTYRTRKLIWASNRKVQMEFETMEGNKLLSVGERMAVFLWWIKEG